MEWKIYYGDGTTISSEDSAPEYVEKRNVQAIVERDESVGRLILTGNDFYWWDDGWFGGDKFGLFDYLIRPGNKVVLFGRTLSNEEYQELHKCAVDDPDFPTKSANSPRESGGR